MKTRALFAVVATALLLGAGSAVTTSPAGAATTCTLRSLDCSGVTTIRFTNTRSGVTFCQTLDSIGVGRCEVYWPFTNPTVNAQAAVGDTTLGYLPNPEAAPTGLARVTTPRETALQHKVHRQHHRIAHLHRVIKRLRHRG